MNVGVKQACRLVTAYRGNLLSLTARSARTMSTQEKPGPVESIIREKLSQHFQPSHLDVINESYMHSVPPGSETHFKVVVVSDMFDKEAIIKRHRMVNGVLQEELEGPVHALSIMAKTPKQWEDSGGKVSKSPACRGGMGL
ncbi:DNA-binding transcriptional regulator BolA-like isoform X2 [Branchiostoma lanceolatum]|uniref:DNA-binding transcriptional regulator BolA-like isoform X2 n=1 Tax=Branchiostoma lanceolatum TaxID=7740 RepID=UPI003452EA53